MESYYNGWPMCEYSKEISQVANEVIKYLKKHEYKRRNGGDNGKPNAVVFDIDDTLLFRDPADVCDISFTMKAFVNKISTTIDLNPPNTPIIRIANECKLNGQKIIILTSRLPNSKEETILNLKINNIPYDDIYFNPCRTSPDGDYGQFKATLRKMLGQKYNIICTIGDQLTDIYLSDPKTAMVKLPEITSRCSYYYFPDI